MKSYNEKTDEGYFLEVVQYPEKLHQLHDLSFLPERMKIEKVEKLVTNLCYAHKNFKASI